MHGIAVLYDCHSIRSVIPLLFEGKLPDFNIGTNDGKSCDAGHRSRRCAPICAASGRLHASRQRPLQGRLDHAPLRPAGDGVHAIQMELAQPRLSARAEALPFAYDDWPRPLRLRVHRSADPCDAGRSSKPRLALTLARHPQGDTQ